MGGRAYAATRRAAPKALRTLATRSRRVRVAAGVVPGRKLVRHREGGSLPSAVQVAMAWAPVRDVGPSLWRRADASRLAGRDLHSLLCNRERSAWFLVTACVRVPKPAASAGARNPVHRRAPRSTPLPERPPRRYPQARAPPRRAARVAEDRVRTLTRRPRPIINPASQTPPPPRRNPGSRTHGAISH